MPEPIPDPQQQQNPTQQASSTAQPQAAPPQAQPSTPVDMDSLMKKMGGQPTSAPSSGGSAQPAVDMDALMKQHGGQPASGERSANDGSTMHPPSFMQRLSEWLNEAEKYNVPVETAIGGAKAAGKTLYGAASLVNKVIPSSIAPAMPPIEEASKAVTGRTDSMDAKGPLQTVGSVGEQAAEWAGGEEVLKGLVELSKVDKVVQFGAWAQKYPKAAKLINSLGRIGRASSTGAAVGTVQGAAEGKAGEGAATGAIVGGGGGAVGELITLIVRAAGNSLMSSKAAMNEKAVEGIKDAAARIFQGPSETASGTQFGEAVLQRVRETRAELGKQFADLEGAIVEQPQQYDPTKLAKVPKSLQPGAIAAQQMAARNAKVAQAVIPIAEINDLGTSAKKFVSEDFRVPKGREETAHLFDAEKRIVDLMNDVANPQKPLSIEDAIAMRQRLLSAADSDGITASQRGAAQKFAGMIDGKIQKVLQDVAPAHAAKWMAARDAYKQFSQTLDNGFLSSMFTKDRIGTIKLARDPVEIGSYLWRESSPTTAAEIKTLVGDKNFLVVQKSILNYMWQEAAEQAASGGKPAEALVKIWNRAGKEGQSAYFTGPLKDQLDGFMKELSKKPSVFSNVLLHSLHGFVYLHHLGFALKPAQLAELSSSAYGVKLLRDSLTSPNMPSVVARLRQVASATANEVVGPKADVQGDQTPVDNSQQP